TVLEPVRPPLHPVQVVGQRPLAGAVHVDDEQLQVVLLLAVAAEDDLLAVRREKGTAVVALRGVRQLADVLAVAVHDVQLEVLLPASFGAEGDLLAVGRVTALGVVAVRVGQALQAGAVGVRLEDRHVGVEVPLVVAALAGLALLVAQAVLLLVLLLRVGVEVAAGEDDLLAVGREIAARRLADAGADADRPAGLQVRREDLVERVAAVLLLGLEDDRLAVRGEVALAGADEVLRDLADVLEV